ncbi:STAS domain-containing protein [Thalassotalea sp. LPB0316]|uniref:STAS domain-containing protein n=1 Tax=Thalassotalea sp. LPB0316 TaxID=2769490 RepID=UPI001866F73D|nr:STAS domain-containing protein [Thalassotalea sp. LPB0316]QOL24777.1 STAS domain-containing protein [Thalassotalea sp. LPB0316]
MPITSHYDQAQQALVIAIDQQFDFSMHQAFKEAYSQIDNSQSTHYIIDLANTTYMDSSALGMILLLREHALASDGKVTIKAPSDSVLKVLEIAQFQKLIDIQR